MSAVLLAALAGVPVFLCPFIEHEWCAWNDGTRVVILVRDRATLLRLMERT